jgi:hypothetical protein
MVFLPGALAQNTFTGTVSIGDAPGFSSQRQCASNCFGVGLGCPSCQLLFLQLSCPNPPMNACFCRQDLTSSALSMISTCVQSNCNYDSVDLQTALGIYSTYCDVTAQPTTTKQIGSASLSTPTQSSAKCKIFYLLICYINCLSRENLLRTRCVGRWLFNISSAYFTRLYFDFDINLLLELIIPPARSDTSSLSFPLAGTSSRPSSPSASTATSEKPPSGLSSGKWAGIGVIIAIVTLVVGIFACYYQRLAVKRKKKKVSRSSATTGGIVNGVELF